MPTEHASGRAAEDLRLARSTLGVVGARVARLTHQYSCSSTGSSAGSSTGSSAGTGSGAST
jgi:hypothetical protein